MDDVKREQLEATMRTALGNATKQQIEQIAELLLKQALAIQAMIELPAEERFRLAAYCSTLREQSDLIWMAILGVDVRIDTMPEGTTKAVAYRQDTGEPVFGLATVQLPESGRENKRE